jgi:hypothetical protein
MAVATRCRWCGKCRGIVMIGEEESGILLCPRCDYANDNCAGPPISEDRVRDTEPRS